MPKYIYDPMICTLYMYVYTDIAVISLQISEANIALTS